MKYIMGLGAAILLTGCAATSPTSATTWSEPGWMAEQAQQREQFVAQLQTCMNSKGWHLTVDDSAGFTEALTSLDELERAGADRDGCLTDQGIDPTSLSAPLTESGLREMYAYDLDTYDCLLANGVGLEDTPPSQEQYVEQGLATQSQGSSEDSWWPYGDPAFLAMSQQEVSALRQTCPERWTFASLS